LPKGVKNGRKKRKNSSDKGTPLRYSIYHSESQSVKREDLQRLPTGMSETLAAAFARSRKSLSQA